MPGTLGLEKEIVCLTTGWKTSRLADETGIHTASKFLWYGIRLTGLSCRFVYCRLMMTLSAPDPL